MPFGITPAPEIFQRMLQQSLDGLEGLLIIADDILVIGEGDTLEEAESNHDDRMLKFLECCVERNIKLMGENSD